jgi:FAD-dependent urate hydroxylase
MRLPSPDRVASLTLQVRADLERIAHPRMRWLEPRMGPDGQPAFDVVVVGGGQSGIATALGLKRARVDNILVIDSSPKGQEGPWLSYARMPTLRSPKDYTGPDLDVPSLTYQSWHEARFGKESWAAVQFIARQHWAEYLLWVREATCLPVVNGTAVTAIVPAAGLLAVAGQGPDGVCVRFHARKVVLATGQEGMGRWWMPDVLARLPQARRAHTADAIDFAGLKGKRVGVLGAGASAFDNAATALEHGAARVQLFCRRASLQVIQPYRWLTFRGFLNHLSDLDDLALALYEPHSRAS